MSVDGTWHLAINTPIGRQHAVHRLDLLVDFRGPFLVAVKARCWGVHDADQIPP